MRKTVFIILLIFLLSITVIYASEISENFINDTADSLFLATIINITDDSITIDPFTKIVPSSTDEALSAITVEKFEYSYCGDHAGTFNIPKIGDNIVISVIGSDEGGYRVKNGAFKADVLDYRLLRILVPVSMKNKDCMGDLIILSYYIRAGDKEFEYLNEDSIVKVNENKRWVTLYPDDDLDYLIGFVDENGKLIENTVSQDIITDFENKVIQPDKFTQYRGIIAITVLVFGLVIGSIVMFFSIRKN